MKVRVSDKNHILDRWILARLSELVQKTTDDLDHYRITEAGRAIADFITDLSTWYVRRSRERMKTGDGVAVLRDVLDVLARLLAPFTPFLAESLWRELGHATSVHLEEWPSPLSISPLHGRGEKEKKVSPPSKRGEVEGGLLADMDLVRRIASLAHENRAKAKIPIRQPLALLTVLCADKLADECVEILKEEDNVRKVLFGPGKGPLSVTHDTTLTPELRREGLLREIVRAVNDLRKQAKLTVADRIVLCYDTDDPATRDVFMSEADKLAAAVRADRIECGRVSMDAQSDLDFNNAKLWIGIKSL